LTPFEAWVNPGAFFFWKHTPVAVLTAPPSMSWGSDVDSLAYDFTLDYNRFTWRTLLRTVVDRLVPGCWAMDMLGMRDQRRAMQALVV
jgi:hypothetical protein